MTQLTYRHWHEGLNPDECVSVDGDAPGRLHLSHWPGHRTPEPFRHQLSTGSCLLLNKSNQREALLKGITTVTNNHWDADGLCSVFALLEPKLAAQHAPTLIATAMAGDFDQFTTPEGVKINLTINALAKHPYSPVRTALFGTALEARTAQYEHGLKLLPKLLENPDLHADWFAREYWTIMQDLRAMREDHAKVKFMDLPDIAVVTGERLYHTMAVNTNAEVGRILTVVTLESGWLYEYRFTTRNWFDFQSPAMIYPRKDWQPILEMLNLIAHTPGGTWVAEDWREPTPRLRFQDAQGNLVPNTNKPKDVSVIIASQSFSADMLRKPSVPEAGTRKLPDLNQGTNKRDTV